MSRQTESKRRSKGGSRSRSSRGDAEFSEDEESAQLSYRPLSFERQYYEELYQAATAGARRRGESVAEGISVNDASRFLALSGLPKQQLHVMISTTSEEGGKTSGNGGAPIISKREFFIAVRLVQLRQNNCKVTDLNLNNVRAERGATLEPAQFKGVSGVSVLFPDPSIAQEILRETDLEREGSWNSTSRKTGRMKKSEGRERRDGRGEARASKPRAETSDKVSGSERLSRGRSEKMSYERRLSRSSSAGKLNGSSSRRHRSRSLGKYESSSLGRLDDNDSISEEEQIYFDSGPVLTRDSNGSLRRDGDNRSERRDGSRNMRRRQSSGNLSRTERVDRGRHEHYSGSMRRSNSAGKLSRRDEDDHASKRRSHMKRSNSSGRLSSQDESDRQFTKTPSKFELLPCCDECTKRSEQTEKNSRRIRKIENELKETNSLVKELKAEIYALRKESRDRDLMLDSEKKTNSRKQREPEDEKAEPKSKLPSFRKSRSRSRTKYGPKESFSSRRSHSADSGSPRTDHELGSISASRGDTVVHKNTSSVVSEFQGDDNDQILGQDMLAIMNKYNASVDLSQESIEKNDETRPSLEKRPSILGKLKEKAIRRGSFGSNKDADDVFSGGPTLSRNLADEEKTSASTGRLRW